MDEISTRADGLMGSPDDKYLLVDGNNLLARAAHAARGRGVHLSAHGVDTSGLLLFINMLAKHVRIVAPTHVSVYWDMGHVFRDAVDPTYKANREKPGHREPLPMEQAKQFLTWAGVPHRARPGWEADDLIAFTARYTMGTKVILSSDRDLLQLLGPHTVQYRPPDEEVWTAERFEAEWGYPPAQMPYIKALMGDKGDNVAGLPRIGPVKAVRMMEAAGWDWETMLSSLTPEQRSVAVTARELTDLRYLDYESKGFSIANCPTCMEFTPTKPSDMLWGALTDFLFDLEMTTVIERLQDLSLWSGGATAEDLVAQRDQSADAFSDYVEA